MVTYDLPWEIHTVLIYLHVPGCASRRLALSSPDTVVRLAGLKFLGSVFFAFLEDRCDICLFSGISSITITFQRVTL